MAPASQNAPKDTRAFPDYTINILFLNEANANFQIVRLRDLPRKSWADLEFNDLLNPLESLLLQEFRFKMDRPLMDIWQPKTGLKVGEHRPWAKDRLNTDLDSVDGVTRCERIYNLDEFLKPAEIGKKAVDLVVTGTGRVVLMKDENDDEAMDTVPELPQTIGLFKHIYKDDDSNRSRKRPRFDFAPTPITEEDSSPPNKWMLAVHQFLWDDKGKEKLEKLITTTTVPVPPLYADTDQQPTSYQAKKYDLTKIPGYDEYKTNSKEAENLLAETFYYRDEYNEVDELDKESARGSRPFDIFLLGHPGIGKTTYLTYRLVDRLARKQPTYLLMSPQNRYLFVDEGVFHIPADKNAVYDLVIRHRTRESLCLYDLNEEHGRVKPSLFCEWRAIVTSSPRPTRYKDWVKNRYPTQFVMKTWSWEEVYIARSMSPVERDDDAWRHAFLKWGGSARHLFRLSEEQLENGLQNAAQQADAKTLLIETGGMKDDISHHLVLANPRDENGKLSRDIMVSKLISPYITRVLLERCHMEMTRSLIDRLKHSLLHGVAGSEEGFLFEEFGHTIVQRSLKRGFKAQLLPKDESAQRLEFKFACLNEQAQYFNQDVHPEKLDTDRYYRPDTRTFAGIDAFALGSQTIVLFQFTLAKDHKINAKWLYDWYQKSTTMKDWKWELIFVVPKECPQLTTSQSMSHKTMADTISQYVFEIDVNTYLA